MQIRCLLVILLCTQLDAADALKIPFKKPALYEVTQLEFEVAITPEARLLQALYKENKEKFSLALVEDARTHICYGREKHSVLAIAAQCTKDPFFVEKLLKFRADVNVTNEQGKTPLMAACAKGSGLVTEVLLAHKADVLVVDNYGNSAFAQAIYFRNLCSLKHLIGHSVDLNGLLGISQDTALTIASHHGRSDLVCALLSYGANPFITNEYGETPLDHALRAPRTEKQERQFEQTAKVLEDYMRYSKEIYKSAVGPLERIIASYLVCECPKSEESKKSH